VARCSESKEDLEDTIDLMDKLLAMADEQEALEISVEQHAAASNDYEKERVEASPLIQLKTPSSRVGSAIRRVPLTASPTVFSASKNKNGGYQSPVASSSLKQKTVQVKTQPGHFKTPTARPFKPAGSCAYSTPPKFLYGPSRRKSLVDVKSKVDSGLRGSPGVSLGLASPVADYVRI
jgi:hypothetical protein